jgi:gluconolactonase
MNGLTLRVCRPALLLTAVFLTAPVALPGQMGTVAPAIPGVVAAGTPVVRVADGLNSSEGPVPAPDGTFLFTENDIGRVVRIDRDGRLSVYLDDTNEGNGLAFDSKGRLISAQRNRPQVGVLAPTRSVLVDSYNGEPLMGPNDLVIDRRDGIYFTDPGRNPPPRPPAVYYLRIDGTLEKVADGIGRPNGIMLSPDEKVLYVADTNGEHIVAFDVAVDGTLGNRRNFGRLTGGRPTESGAMRSGADGLAVDSAGRLYVATDAGVQVLDVNGRHLGTIPMPRDPQNLAFGGPDKKTLYVVGSGSVYTIAMESQGFLGRPK